MPSFRELEWLARRRDGESPALIARNAGVSVHTVRAATDPYGPFQRPSRQHGRVTLPDEVLDERARRWVQQRRRGVPATVLAQQSGVGHQVVSWVTAGFGPFPSDDVVRAWVTDRRKRRPVQEIAEEYGTRAGVVRALTAPAGPFPETGARAPESVETMASIARRAKVAPSTVLQWRAAGLLPEPDFVTARGRAVWLPSTIERWLEGGPLEECPDCGARTRSLKQHRGRRHR